MTDVYCSTKFKELQVHIQSRLLYNCCKAWPERIDLDWLEKNPGKIFYTPTMIKDRLSMLSGKRSESCNFGCYQYEDNGLTSSRLEAKKEYIDDVNHPLLNLKIVLSTDCNLICTYCSSEYSTAWYKDLEKNGEYDIENYENKKTNWAKLWSKTKQKDRSTDSKFFNLLLKEISLSPQIKKINILGGEPLLNNNLLKLINNLEGKTIFIDTGLGVSYEKFKNFIDQIKDNKNISLNISAESTGKLFEFIRNGSNWEKFISMISYLKNQNITFRFQSVVSNITSFGLVEFYKIFGKDYNVHFNPVHKRPFLSVNVLDDKSKELFYESIKNIDNKSFLEIKKTMSQPYTEKQKNDLSIFLKEFSKRKNLKLDIFPLYFREWLNLI